MGMLSELLITNAFWTWSLNLFIDLCKNYGWAIILFTIVLKLILSPLDYMQAQSYYQKLSNASNCPTRDCKIAKTIC